MGDLDLPLGFVFYHFDDACRCFLLRRLLFCLFKRFFLCSKLGFLFFSFLFGLFFLFLGYAIVVVCLVDHLFDIIVVVEPKVLGSFK